MPRPRITDEPPPPLHRRLWWVIATLFGLTFMLGLVYRTAAAALLGVSMVSVMVWLLADAAYVLFGQARVKLEELIFLVMVLGAVVGVEVRTITGMYDDPTQRALTIVFSVVITSFWIIRGAGWGLWVATVEDKHDAAYRVRHIAY